MLIYKAAISSSIDSGCISGTEVGPVFPSAGVSEGPNVLKHLLTLRNKQWNRMEISIHPIKNNNCSPDDRLVVFRWFPSGPSGMKNATNRAQTTKNDPNTNGGPGRAYKIDQHIHVLI